MTSLAGQRILIGPSTFAALDPRPMERLLGAGCQVVPNPVCRKLTKVELLGLLAGGVTGLIAGLEPLDRDVLMKSQLRVISRCGAGLSNVDVSTAAELNILVYCTPDAPTNSVAELTLSAMLALLRMTPEMDRELHGGRWHKKIGRQLEGRSVAIIGYGRIGRRVAELLEPFRTIVLAVDPCLSRSPQGARLLSLAEALPQADIVTIHASGSDPILGVNELALLRPGALVLNAARGGVMDEVALLKALEEGRVAGAWLDVFEMEPYNGPLTDHANVILTPHVGSYTEECRSQMEIEAVENLIGGFQQILQQDVARK